VAQHQTVAILTTLRGIRGLPGGLIGRCGITASPAQPSRVWALVEAEDALCSARDDYGDTWEKLSADPDLRRRPWYYMHAYAIARRHTVWVLNLIAGAQLTLARRSTASPPRTATTTDCGSIRAIRIA